ncbi:hypothetical protein [Hyphococcus sp.]|jgi:hypothetical protein|uniref:hypothetical protein n=1 Tax=Hyphococcus sp. TaxID=2038636 RepID=UPI003D0BD09A
MPKLDQLLLKYKERTACEPVEPVELKVLAKLRAGQVTSVRAIAARPPFRQVAVASGFFTGLIAVGLAPVTTTATATDFVPELAAFAPDAPELPSTWFGRKVT